MTSTALIFPNLERPIVRDVVDRHIEDAAFFWQQRDQAARTFDTVYRDLQALDKKIQRHLLGVWAAGLAGWRRSLEALERYKSSGEMFVSVSTALMLTNDTLQNNRVHDKTALIDSLLVMLRTNPGLKNGFLSGFNWLDQQYVDAFIKNFFDAKEIDKFELALSICVLRRVNPGEHLLTALRHEDLSIQNQALQAVGVLGIKQYKNELKNFLTIHEPAQQFWSAWSLVLLGDRALALQVLCEFSTDKQHPFQDRALCLAVRALPFDRACDLLNQVKSIASTQVLIIACGDLGVADSVKWLLEQMRIPEVSTFAKDAFFRITGESDAALADPNETQKWWKIHGSEFQSYQRYLLGKPLDESQLLYALHNGTQRVREGAALDLMLLEAHSFLFNVY